MASSNRSKKKWKALLGQIQNTIGKSQKLANTIHLTRIYMIASSQPVAVNTVLMPKRPFSENGVGANYNLYN